MTHRDFRAKAVRHAVSPALVTALALVSCSSAPPPPPDTFVNLKLGPHVDMAGNNLCSNATMTPVLVIGTATGSVPQIQADGSQNSGGGGNVSVSCTVRGSFDVSLTAALGGTTGGTLDISGHVTASDGGSNINASFTSNGLSHSETDCTIAFMYNGAPVGTKPPIAGGRIWAHLKCPSMANPAHQQRLADGSQVSETCDGEADFLFDNCNQ
jgi:hypothetical protein